MSPLGRETMDWLAGRGDVTILRDASVRYGYEAITCCLGGADYRITIESGPPGSAVKGILDECERG